jgi:hypothetical protein
MRINAWVDKPSPPPSAGSPWRAECQTATSHHVVDAPTQPLAQEALARELGPMVTIDWHFGPAPRPKRRDGTPQADQMIEHESAFRKSLLRHFHSDLIGTKQRFSADQVVSAINECWEQTRAKA